MELKMPLMAVVPNFAFLKEPSLQTAGVIKGRIGRLYIIIGLY